MTITITDVTAITSEMFDKFKDNLPEYDGCTWGKVDDNFMGLRNGEGNELDPILVKFSPAHCITPKEDVFFSEDILLTNGMDYYQFRILGIENGECIAVSKKAYENTLSIQPNRNAQAAAEIQYIYPEQQLYLHKVKELTYKNDIEITAEELMKKHKEQNDVMPQRIKDSMKELELQKESMEEQHKKNGIELDALSEIKDDDRGI